jgi:hypothetical protein
MLRRYCVVAGAQHGSVQGRRDEICAGTDAISSRFERLGFPTPLLDPQTISKPKPTPR